MEWKAARLEATNVTGADRRRCPAARREVLRMQPRHMQRRTADYKDGAESATWKKDEERDTMTGPKMAVQVSQVAR